ncbi:MAG: S16 family serine protease [Methanospirillum sp.]
MKPDHLIPILVVALVAVLAVALVAIGLTGSLPSIAGNAGEQQLVDRIGTLEHRNIELQQQLDQQNLSVRSYEDQLAFYRGKASGPITGSLSDAPGVVIGSASLEAPAVLQKTVYEQDGPFVSTRTEQEGSLLNVSVEIKPGEGRVLVNTTPLMGTNFQDAAILAAAVAEKKTGKDLSDSDVIVSIVAEDQVPAVDGGSAGALMTLLMISAIEKTQPQGDLIMTGTIDKDGNVGAIGGVVEKATAAKEAGKTLLLLPRENSQLVQYTEQTRNYYGHTFVQSIPEQVDAKEYIESTIGIRVEYVDTIDDVLGYVG